MRGQGGVGGRWRQSGAPFLTMGLSLWLGIWLLSGPPSPTLATIGQPRPHPWLLSGTRENIAALGGHGAIYMHLPEFAILDFPCSLALDLLLVPVTLPFVIFEEKPKQDRREGSGQEK